MFPMQSKKNKGGGGGHFVQRPTETLHEKVNQERRETPRPTNRENFDMDAFKHQVAKISAIMAWIVSIYFSYEGFKFQNDSILWVGYFLAFLVSCGELMFNTEVKKLSLTLILIGIACYGYGVYSSVVGFWSVQFPTESFVWNNNKSMMSWFVGAFLEIYPEAAFAWGMRATTGDLAGNLASLASGVVTGQKTYQINEEFRGRLK